jgi:hypothetical protein
MTKTPRPSPERGSAKAPPNYPFQERGVRADLTADEAALLGHESASAATRRPPAAAVAFRGQAVKAAIHFADPVAVPSWVKAQIQKQVKPGEFLELLVKRSLRAGTEENLRLALALANEIGRKEDGAPALRRVITQKLVDQLAGGKGEA